MYLVAVVSLRDIDSISLKKSILGDKLILTGNFFVDLKPFERQKRKVLEIRRLNNFDICAVYNFLSKKSSCSQRRQINGCQNLRYR